jgi:hypothetical protein
VRRLAQQTSKRNRHSTRRVSLKTRLARRSAIGKSNAAKDAADKAREKAGEVAKEAEVIEGQLANAVKEQNALQWHINLVAKSVSPRLIDRKRFAQLMRGQPKASVEIWYEPNDEEAKFLAMQLNTSLGKDGLGWDATVGPFPNISPDEFHAQLRSEAGGGLNGLVYAAKTVTLDLDSPLAHISFLKLA